MLPTEVLEKSARPWSITKARFRHRRGQPSRQGVRGRQRRGDCLCKKLLNLGNSHDVVFLQGGATMLFTTIPMNFLHGAGDYLAGGEWSKKAAGAAKDLGKVNIVGNTEATNFDHSTPQNEWTMSENADYFHVCSNETVHGHRLAQWPKHPNLIVDASSEFMSRPHPASECALVYGGAQKNLGPSAWCWRLSARTCTRNRRRSRRSSGASRTRPRTRAW